MTGTTDQGGLAQLAADFGGDLIAPDDARYDEARKVFNGMIDKRPALVARPAGTADVVTAVNYARERELPISVRCGAHSAIGHGTNDGGIVIDLSRMKGVHVDRARRTARAAGGVQWGEFDRETQAFGLATPGGRVTTTGVGGFCLGGGYGWMSTKYGLTCDNLISAEVVTADGRVLTASETENEELFWALRGGGGNFGVVTSFEFRLHEFGPMVYGGLLLFRLEQAAEAIAVWREIAENAPDELATAAAFVTAPPEEFVPEDLRLQAAFGIPGLWMGSDAEGAELMAPLKALGPAVDLFGPIPYRGLQAMLDASAPPGLRSYWRGEHLTGLSDELLDAFVAHPTTGLHWASYSVIFQHGGAVSRVPEDATAFSHREAKYMFHPISVWEDPADDERQLLWLREASDALRPFTTGGVYLNFTADEGEDRVRAGFGDEKYERLARIKAEYDPDNLFRFNQNVKPALVTA